MKAKISLWAALLALAILVGLVPPGLQRSASRENLTPPRADWEGVCDIWLCETFAPGRGTLLGWVQKAAARLEKANRGLFFRIRVLEPDVARTLLAAGESLPDGILAGGGVITSNAALLSAPEQSAITPAYLAAVTENGRILAQPVAAGAYTVLFDQEALTAAGLDEALTEEDLAALTQTQTYKKEAVTRYALSFARADTLCPAAALCDLYPNIAPENIAPASPTRSRKDAWADFVLDKRSVGYIATQKEVYRIRQLLAGGSAFPWVGSARACRYTDQLLCLYTLAQADTGCSTAVQLLGSTLQSEESQRLLADYGAFSVRAGLTIYEDGTLMHRMELGLADPLVPNQFSLQAQLAAMQPQTPQQALLLAWEHLAACKKD